MLSLTPFFLCDATCAEVVVQGSLWDRRTYEDAQAGTGRWSFFAIRPLQPAIPNESVEKISFIVEDLPSGSLLLPMGFIGMRSKRYSLEWAL